MSNLWDTHRSQDHNEVVSCPPCLCLSLAWNRIWDREKRHYFFLFAKATYTILIALIHRKIILHKLGFSALSDYATALAVKPPQFHKLTFNI